MLCGDADVVEDGDAVALDLPQAADGEGDKAARFRRAKRAVDSNAAAPHKVRCLAVEVSARRNSAAYPVEPELLRNTAKHCFASKPVAVRFAHPHISARNAAGAFGLSPRAQAARDPTGVICTENGACALREELPRRRVSKKHGGPHAAQVRDEGVDVRCVAGRRSSRGRDVEAVEDLHAAAVAHGQIIGNNLFVNMCGERIEQNA